MQFSEQVIEVLKWVGIVFLAGFIGYFGRYLSMVIIERLHKKKAKQSLITESSKKNTDRKQDIPKKDGLKIEKKRLKAAQKAKKKKDSSG